MGASFAMIIPNSQGEVEMMTCNAVIGCMLILAGMLACEIKPLKYVHESTEVKTQHGN